VRKGSGNLTAALLVVAVGELVVSRVIDRLFLTSLGPHAASHPHGWARFFLGAGPFLTNLCGVLAIGLFAGAVVGLVKRGELFPRALRITTAFISLFLVALAIQGLMLGHLGERTFAHLEISSGFLSLLILLSVWFAPIRRAAKAAFSFLALPGLLHVISVFCESTGFLKGSAVTPVALATVGEGFLFLAGFFLPLTVRQTRRSPVLGAWLVTALVVTSYALLVALRYDLLATLALHGLRVDLPELPSVLGILSLFSLGGFVWSLVRLASDKGPSRLMAYGALLVAVAGYQVVSPVEMSVSLVGLLAFATGLVRRAQSEKPLMTLGGPRWRDFVAELASSLGDTSTPAETTIVQEGGPETGEAGGRELSRIASQRGGQDVVVRLFRRQGVVEELSIAVGDPGHLEADASVARPTSWLSRGPGEHIKKARVRTGDAAFDRRLVIHGTVDLSDPQLRRRLEEQIEGVLLVWRGRAARYTAQPSQLGDGAFGDVQALVGLVETILELMEPASAGPSAPSSLPS